MKKTILSILFLLPLLAIAQISPRPNGGVKKGNSSSNTQTQEDLSQLSFKQRLVPGGGLQLQFGNQTMVNLSPTLGYRLTNRWVAGLGFNYLYYRQSWAGVSTSLSVFGSRAFTYYQLLDNVIAYSEYEKMSIPFSNPSIGMPERYWNNSLWLGVGYRQWMGPRTALDILLLYDVIYNPTTSLYSTPFNYRMTMSFRL